MTEELLLKELKQNKIRNLYYLYGKETFLVQTYADKILKAGLDVSEHDFNLVKFSGNPEISRLDESVNALPVFAERRVVILNDLDAEKLDNASLEDVSKIFSEIPETTIVIINLTGIEPDLKKAKTKKLLSVIEKFGVAVNFDRMNEVKAAELIMRRVSRAGCTISQSNAAYIARLCLRNLTLIAAETDKLCAYMNYTGEIIASVIDKLIVKQLDAGVFSLASEITSRKSKSALLLLDELIELGNPPVMIMSALSATFIDFYRAKLGSESRKRSEQIAADFNYQKNRAWAVGKAMSAVSRIPAAQLRKCVMVLCDADYKLKSSPVDDRIIMERAVAELLILC